MIFWLDAQLSPSIAAWMRERLGVNAYHVMELGLRDSEDLRIFESARQANAVILTKDADFEELVLRLGSPPQIVLMSCGNTSNAKLKVILEASFDQTLELLKAGERLVEIRDS